MTAKSTTEFHLSLIDRQGWRRSPIDCEYAIGLKMFRTDRRSKPSARVRAAMWRFSRDRWMAPWDVRKIGWMMSCAASGSPSAVYRHAIGMDCEAVGMYRGQPIISAKEPGFCEVLKHLELAEKRFGAKGGEVFSTQEELRLLIKILRAFAHKANIWKLLN